MPDVRADRRSGDRDPGVGLRAAGICGSSDRDARRLRSDRFVTFRVFAANDSMCTDSATTLTVPVRPRRRRLLPERHLHPAGAAGAYKWVASYSGDALHAASTTACDNPAGAFAVVAPPTVSRPSRPGDRRRWSRRRDLHDHQPAGEHRRPDRSRAREDVAGRPRRRVSERLERERGAGTITAGPGSQSVTLAGGTIPSARPAASRCRSRARLRAR